jgi:phosphatidylserine/phosphatidylglycerophosphate/cardiolipin synthase-like enzyme
MATRSKSSTPGGRKSRSKRKRSTRLSLSSFLLTAGLLCLAYFWWRGDVQSWLERYGLPVPDISLGTPLEPTPRPVVTVPTGEIQVFFTTPSLVYPDVPKDRVMPDFEQALIADIDGARASVEMTSFEYNLKPLADALIRAKQRGVEVRLALDRESLADPTDAKWTGRVEAAQIPISWEDSDAFMHSKFVIVDGRIVWTGSWNATINDTYRNNNNLLRITIPELVQNYRVEFDELFTKTFGAQKQSSTPFPRIEQGTLAVENYFSPKEPVATHILERLENAQQSVRFLAFAYTSDEIGEAMVAAAERGLIVQGVMESRNAGGQGSELSRLRRNGVEVLEDGNCYTMHHKVIVVDDRTVITGSYNFTSRAENVNDENLLIIDDPTIAGLYLAEFQRVYDQAQNPTRCES